MSDNDTEMQDDEIELTSDEMDAVNVKIESIKDELDISILNITNDDFKSAIGNVDNSIYITDCMVCKRELGVLKADIMHAHAICELEHETCEEEKEVLIDTATELRDDFIPIRTEKKALIDKRNEHYY